MSRLDNLCGFTLLVLFLGVCGPGLVSSGSRVVTPDSTVGVPPAGTLAERVAGLGLSELAAALADGTVGGADPHFALLEGLGAPTGEEADAALLSSWRESDPVYRAIEALRAKLGEGTASRAEAQMAAWLQEAMGEGLTTGYNIVAAGDWPVFEPDRTLIYGHSSPKHALQLLMLLRFHNLDVNFEFVVKRSGFLYRDGWGNGSADLEVLPNGQKMILADEYDLFLSFPQPGDRVRFARLVDRFAKRDSPEESGLIHGAWWQPFYRSFNEVGQMGAASVIAVHYKGYRSNILVQNAIADTRRAQLATRFPQMEFRREPVWVNPSFFRYIKGDFR